MSWLRAFPDAQVSIDNEVVAGDTAVTQVTFAGMHTETLAGSGGEIPATGRHVTGRAAEVIRSRMDRSSRTTSTSTRWRC
jgi:predicted ester cyclase